MKNIILAFALLLAASPLFSQTTCTPGGGITCTPTLNLWLLPQHYTNWGTPWNQNATEVDTYFGTTIQQAPAGNQTLTQSVGTWFNVNGENIFGSPSWLRFGASANIPDSALTRTAAGVFSLDTTSAGNGLASLNLAGLKITGSGGTNGQCLGSNGTLWGTAINCLTASTVLYYQIVDLNAVAQTQRLALNFSNRFTTSDSASPSRTGVELNAPGTGRLVATYLSSPSTSTNCAAFDGNGNLVPSSSSSCSGPTTTRTCNANGCYRVEADGTIEQWGVSSTAGSATSAASVTITFPSSFTTTTNLSLTTSATSDATGDGSPHAADCHVVKTSISTSGATAVIAAVVQIGGSGYSNLASGDYCSWYAVGR